MIMCERTVESARQDKKPSDDFLSGPYLDPTLKNDTAKGAKGGRRIKCEQPHVWPPFPSLLKAVGIAIRV